MYITKHKIAQSKHSRHIFTFHFFENAAPKSFSTPQKSQKSVRQTKNLPHQKVGQIFCCYLLKNQSFSFAQINSRFRRAMCVSETPLGHSAAQAPVLVQLPKPSSSIFESMALARAAASTLPCGNSAN